MDEQVKKTKYRNIRNRLLTINRKLANYNSSFQGLKNQMASLAYIDNKALEIDKVNWLINEANDVIQNINNLTNSIARKM